MRLGSFLGDVYLNLYKNTLIFFFSVFPPVVPVGQDLLGFSLVSQTLTVTDIWISLSNGLMNKFSIQSLRFDTHQYALSICIV